MHAKTVSEICYACVMNVSHTCCTCVLPVSYMYQTCVIHASYVCHACVIHMSRIQFACVIHVTYMCHTYNCGGTNNRHCGVGRVGSGVVCFGPKQHTHNRTGASDSTMACDVVATRVSRLPTTWRASSTPHLCDGRRHDNCCGGPVLPRSSIQVALGLVSHLLLQQGGEGRHGEDMGMLGRW